MNRTLLLLFACLLAGRASAAPTIDADRPGFLFAGTTVPRGWFQIEVGLPDATISGGTQVESLDAYLRVGLAEGLEVQVGGPVFNHLHASGAVSANGAGDLNLGVKYAPGHLLGPSTQTTFLGYLLVPTGSDVFSAGGVGTRLSAQTLWSLTDRLGTGLQLGFGWVSGTVAQTSGQLAGSFSYQLADPLNGFVEAEYIHAFSGAGGEQVFAGAGLAYVPVPQLQLDVSVDRGLTSDSTDWLMGFGVSVLL